MNNILFYRVNSDKTFSPNRDNAWYNLSTDHFISKLNKEMWSLRGLRLVGTLEELSTFWLKNLYILPSIYPPETDFNDIAYQPFKDISVILSEVEHTNSNDVCIAGTAGSIIPFTETTNIDDLNDEQMSSLCPWSLTSLILKVKTNEIIDGDTLYISFFLPLIQLGANRKISGKIKTPILIPDSNISNMENYGMFIKIKCRMYGYDAQEKNTPEGQLAKHLFEEKIKYHNRKFWALFLDPEKYGRTLLILYPRIDGQDLQKSNSLNEYMASLADQNLTSTYLGGTKTF